jgi:hypothetical protein
MEKDEIDWMKDGVYDRFMEILKEKEFVWYLFITINFTFLSQFYIIKFIIIKIHYLFIDLCF